MEPGVPIARFSVTEDPDDVILRQLGYKPVLSRNWSKITNAAITVSGMSVLLSITASYGTGLTYGGPVVMVWGWIVVSLMCICVALGMSELASAYPTSGGMYFWMYQLCGPKYGPFVCWVNGWLNLLGQISSLAGTHYASALLIETFILLATGTASVNPGLQPPPDAPSEPYAPPDAPYAPLLPGTFALPDAPAAPPDPEGTGFVFNSKQTLGVYGGLLILTATLNSISPRFMQRLTELGAYFHLLGIIVVVIAPPLLATEHQSAEWVFTKYYSDLGVQYGIENKVYIGMLGLLLPAFAYTGYDGPAHMAEESKDAAIANPRGIMAGMYFMAVTGFVWIISLLFCTTNRLYILGETDVTPEADGDPVPQIFWDVMAQHLGGNGVPSLGLLIIPLLGVVFCSLSTLTYISRIMFAYSRDRAVPLSSLWIKVAPNKVPVFAVWGAAILAFIIAIPSVRNELAFTSILSLSTIALNVAYVAPSFVRITFGRKRFKPGPWNLGIWAYPINAIATGWVTFAVIIFSLPTEYPVDWNTNLNYAGFVLAGVFLLSVVWFWCPFIGAYRWFKGPVNEFMPADGEEFVAKAQAQLANEELNPAEIDTVDRAKGI